MNQQQAAGGVEQQVLAAPAHLQHGVAHQLRGFTAQGPAQRLAHLQGNDFCAGNAVGKTQAGHFNFGQFRHGFADIQ